MRSLFFRKKRNGLIALEGLDSPNYNASACKTGPSFGAPPAQHLSTAFGGHPFPETMVSCSTQSAWLKWSFHVSTSLIELISGCHAARVDKHNSAVTSASILASWIMERSGRFTKAFLKKT
jgi:hypothetical protein